MGADAAAVHAESGSSATSGAQSDPDECASGLDLDIEEQDDDVL